MRGKQHCDQGDGQIKSHSHVGPIPGRHYGGSQRFCHLAKLTSGNQGHDRAKDEEDHAESKRKPTLRSTGGFVQNRLQDQSKPLDDEAESHERNRSSLPCQQRAFRGKEYAWITKIGAHCWTVLRDATGAYYQLI